MQKAVAVALGALAALGIVVRPFPQIVLRLGIPVAGAVPVSSIVGAAGVELWIRGTPRSHTRQGDASG